MNEKTTVFLTGASSGIGAAMATYLLEEGYAVWGTSRCKERLAGFPAIHPIEMHLEDPVSVRNAWQQALTEAGKIDIVIQNAGSGIFGSIEDISFEQSSFVWKVLVEGPLLILQLAAEHFRPRRTGLIVGISSLAAELPICFSSHYSAGKAAFSSLLAGLSMELEPFGVEVVDVRPGDIRTSFNHGLPTTIPKDSPYFPWARKAWERNEHLMKNAPESDIIDEILKKLLRDQCRSPLLRIGSFFQSQMSPFLSRLIPHRMKLKMIRSYYGLNTVPPIDSSVQNGGN